MTKLAMLVLSGLLCMGIAQSADLTINAVPGPVGPQTTLTGKAPSADAKVFLIINPVETPEQFWVQKIARIVDGKKNWTCSIHVGEVGPKYAGQQFIVYAVADPDKTLPEGNIGELPAAKWTSQPVTLTRK
jgi:hypothetical protein